MKDWFEQRSARERMVLMGGGVILLILFLYVGLWQPLARANDRLNSEVETGREEVAWMRSAAVEVRLLGQRSSKPSADTKSLLARVTAELRRDKMTASRVRPEGDDRLRMNLERVAFTRMLSVLDRLQSRYGVNVRESAVEPVNGSPGLVNVQLYLAREGQ